MIQGEMTQSDTTRKRPIKISNEHAECDFVLSIFEGNKEVRTIDLRMFNKSIITFGRRSDNDIVIASPIVSRQHGSIKIVGSRLFIEDNPDSSYGLLYKGELISSIELCDGDNIRIDHMIKSESGYDIIEDTERSENGVLLVFSKAENNAGWSQFTDMSTDRITIGREPDCKIQINHISVSKLHAVIERKNDEFVISDTFSSTGVTVNGVMLQGRRVLHEKDVILIANAKLVFSKRRIDYCVFRSGISVEAMDIVKYIPKKDLTICDHVSLKIEPGELVAIIGGSGAGKSTLMNCLCGYSVPTEGTVLINGENLYDNLSVFSNIIGYVPQADIVYDNLTVEDMLGYAAKLRLPDDSTDEELSEAVARSIGIVELTGKEKTLIRELSGGQKKRASIAVELLSDPNLLFLDEPSSGLDPVTERNLMNTLKNMAESGKTVILVTHSTLQLQMCDKIVFMGRGGKLCYYGNYEKALDYFKEENIIDIYDLITKNSSAWQKKFLSDERRRSKGEIVTAAKEEQRKKRRSTIHQSIILSQRYIKLLLNDRQRLLLVLLQSPLLALLIYLVSDGKQFEQYEMTKSLLFALACSAFWVGTLNSIQEVCKERVILKREYMTGLNLFSYIFSKFIVLGALCAVQSALIIGVFALCVGQPEEGVIMAPFLEMYITTFLVSMAATAMGIFVSSLFKNADRAMTVAPLLLMPQILFSGLVFKLSGATEKISWFAACRWAMECYGTIANLNDLPLRYQQMGYPIEHDHESLFEYTTEHLLTSWLVLFAFVVVFFTISGIILRNLKKER